MLAKAFTIELHLQALIIHCLISFSFHLPISLGSANTLARKKSYFKERHCLSLGFFGYKTVQTLQSTSILRKGKGWRPDVSQESSMYARKTFQLVLTTCKTSLQDGVETRQRLSQWWMGSHLDHEYLIICAFLASYNFLFILVFSSLLHPILCCCLCSQNSFLIHGTCKF